MFVCFFFRKVSIPKGRLTDTQVIEVYRAYIKCFFFFCLFLFLFLFLFFCFFFILMGHYSYVFIPEGNYSKVFLFPKVIIPKADYSERFFFILRVIISKFVILIVHYSKIRNIKTRLFGITTFRNNDFWETVIFRG